MTSAGYMCSRAFSSIFADPLSDDDQACDLVSQRGQKRSQTLQIWVVGDDDRENAVVTFGGIHVVRSLQHKLLVFFGASVFAAARAADNPRSFLRPVATIYESAPRSLLNILFERRRIARLSVGEAAPRTQSALRRSGSLAPTNSEKIHQCEPRSIQRLSAFVRAENLKQQVESEESCGSRPLRRQRDAREQTAQRKFFGAANLPAFRKN